jgi:hypothetical protein
MSEERLHVDAVEDPVAETTVTSRRLSRPRVKDGGSAHSHRFHTAIGMLLGLGVASLAAAALLLGSHGAKHTSSGTWSAFRPRDDGLAGAQEIADYIAPLYRATNANQLAVVTALDLSNPANPLQIIVPASGTASGLQALPPRSTIAFDLCGVGSRNCSIGAGTASPDRLLLLRREALELALYTFQYISAANTVVAILPPGKTARSSTLSPKPPSVNQSSSATQPVSVAVAFARDELAPFLRQPLRATLPGDLPPNVSEMPRSLEAKLVSVITAHGLFAEQAEQSQDGSRLIVLSPLRPQ